MDNTSPDFNVTNADKYTPAQERYNSDEHESLYNPKNEDICSVNEYGKKFLELCIETEIRILNSRILVTWRVNLGVINGMVPQRWIVGYFLI